MSMYHFIIKRLSNHLGQSCQLIMGEALTVFYTHLQWGALGMN